MGSLEKKDGGPAFACAAENGHQEGMALRDWFAGQVIAGTNWNFKVERTDAEEYAKAAYLIADAMLTEREK